MSQGAEAVLAFIRGHRHSDLFSAESERSAQQVAASRDQLLQSLSEAEARADELFPSAETTEAAAGECRGERGGGERAAPTVRSTARSAQRRKNSGFFS